MATVVCFSNTSAAGLTQLPLGVLEEKSGASIYWEGATTAEVENYNQTVFKKYFSSFTISLPFLTIIGATSSHTPPSAKYIFKVGTPLMFALDFFSLGNETWELYQEAKANHDALWQIPFPNQKKCNVLILLSKGPDRLHYKIFPLPVETQNTDEDEDENWSETADEYSDLRDLLLKNKIYILLGMPEASQQGRGIRKQLQMDVYSEENILLTTVIFQSASNNEWVDLTLTGNTVTPTGRYETPLAPFWVRHINNWIKTNIKEGRTPSNKLSMAKGAVPPNGKGFGQLTMKQNGCRELNQGSKKFLLPQTSHLLDNSICLGLLDAGTHAAPTALHLATYNWFETHKWLLLERSSSIIKLQILNILASSAVHITGKGLERAVSWYRSRKSPVVTAPKTAHVQDLAQKPAVQHVVGTAAQTDLVEVVISGPPVQPFTNTETFISAGVSLYRASGNVGVRMRTQRELQISKDGAKTLTQRDLRPAKDQKQYSADEYLAVVGPPKGKAKVYEKMKGWYHSTIPDTEARRRLESVLGGLRTRGTHLVYKSPTDNQYYLLVASSTKAIYKVLIEKTGAGQYFFKSGYGGKKSSAGAPASFQSISKLLARFSGFTGKSLWVEEKVSIKLRDYATM
ncbi:SH2 domain-containing protein [Endozoicomonas arenosclerae]|uniref:SH2 domain-containing protein n=1 Tax=Endozoicomonas arenosclerae TaxID=1633495 RepID=UPI001C12A3C5|nr:SH2 domain-containing protein [Endozoicomonas arenosclerae]